MEDLVKVIVILIIGGVLGGFIATYIDFRKQIFSEIWQKRFDHDKKLWAISGHLPKWPKDTSVTYKKLYNISVGLKNWYFNDGGGILLSTKSRELYGELQKILTLKLNKESNDVISVEDYNVVMHAFSTLRTQMIKDLSNY